MNRPPHERFLRALRSRLVFTRAIENLGICTLAGCAIALPLLFVLLGHEQSTIFPLVFIGSLVILGATALTIQRWPSLLTSAAEADSQLGWADLLATAVLLVREKSAPSDALIAPVLAMADARCQQVSPSDVMLKRFSARAWGGIFLSLFAVLAVSMIPIHPLGSAAGENFPALTDVDQSREQQIASPSIAYFPAAKNDDPSSEDSDERKTPQAQSADHASTSNLASRNTNPAIGAGGDFSTTTGALQSNVQPAIDAASPPVSTTGVAAGGGASTAFSGVAGNISGPGSNAPSHTVPPWQETSWITDSNFANLDPTGRRIPAGDLDLVRNYFDRK